MIDIEERAFSAMNKAFCWIRYFSKRSLSEKGREYLFLIADAAHNIPIALAGNEFLRESLERDVLELEALLIMVESSGITRDGFTEQRARRSPLFKRILSTIGFGVN